MKLFAMQQTLIWCQICHFQAGPSIFTCMGGQDMNAATWQRLNVRVLLAGKNVLVPRGPGASTRLYKLMLGSCRPCQVISGQNIYVSSGYIHYLVTLAEQESIGSFSRK